MERKQVEEQFKIIYLDSLEFIDQALLEEVKGKVEKKIDKYAQMNHWATALFGEGLLKKKEVPYLIKKVNPLVGYGVFAKETICELTYIGEYTGLVRKRKKRKDSLNDYVFGYVVGPQDTPWVIDAREKGNFTRFINHSYTPNLTSRWIIAEGISHIIFFANRLIQPGEQLTYDYGPYYWRKRSFPQAF